MTLSRSHLSPPSLNSKTSTSTPLSYDLKVTPNFDTFTFEGDVSIELVVRKDQLVGDLKKQITLHSKELCYVSASYTISSSSAAISNDDTPAPAAVAAEEIRVNLKATTVTFCFPEEIPLDATSVVLSIQFSGFLNNQMAGFYRSKYTDIEGKEQWMASTQFEALDARRCFPCFDEPARKAVFGFTMTLPSHLHVFSNMPEKESISLSKTTKQVSFLDTPLMSTYLLAFCVGEFDCVQAQTNNGVLVKVYTPPGKSPSGTFALDCAVKCLDHYDAFFGSHYPLPKLDMVAIPEFVSCDGCFDQFCFGCVSLTLTLLCIFSLSLPTFILKGYGRHGELGFGHLPRSRSAD